MRRARPGPAPTILLDGLSSFRSFSFRSAVLRWLARVGSRPARLRKSRISHIIRMTVARMPMARQPRDNARVGAAHPLPRPHVAAGMRSALMAPDPLYKQVRSDLVNRLCAGEWKPGEALPSERKLADHYGVGIATIRAAIGELTAMKVLARRQGKGTYVCREEERRSVYQFFHIVRDDGIKALPVSDLVWIKSGLAAPDIAHALELPRSPGGLAIHRLRNVLTVNGVRVAVSDIAAPVAMFPGLTQQRIRTGGATLYAVYQNRSEER